MKNFLSTGTQESITRLSFFLTVIMILIWETYAVFSATTIPNIEAILLFAGGILANKQFQERKAAAPPEVL